MDFLGVSWNEDYSCSFENKIKKRINKDSTWGSTWLGDPTLKLCHLKQSVQTLKGKLLQHIYSILQQPAHPNYSNTTSVWESFLRACIHNAPESRKAAPPCTDKDLRHRDDQSLAQGLRGGLHRTGSSRVPIWHPKSTTFPSSSGNQLG